jgi:integrating conjugative element protein (TIGR03765 family)
MKRRLTPISAVAFLFVSPAFAQSPPLIVVEDNGGVSALPYYEALSPPPRQDQKPLPPPMTPVPPDRPLSEADMLPVRSEKLSPGDVARRVIQAPGLTPLFLIGDDTRSRAWLKVRGPALRERNAVGLVVNIETAEALTLLRQAAGGLTLSPVSGDDLATRLGLSHYPVLITATGIEQ